MSATHVLRISVGDLPPEGLPWSGQVPASALEMPEDDRVRFTTPIHFDLRVFPVQAEILVEGQLQARLTCACDRCLAVFEVTLKTSDVCHLLATPAEGLLDLTEEIREDMLLALPNRCLCREDCRGLCPQCGADLNSGECRCEGERLGCDAWGALDQVRPTSRPRK
ncbi:MAG: hypothetical protein A3K19_00225 [Lentisphaerae bacterium RIFOXYB12_FULL_65_16]|nr:MAG: hypothetical protein A3K18_04880 [Lentisphaerae bacterium RIFOXYA12_64_32]OGV85399.1 MAG: hypothetical protein A3K19_00225 [Lentisphaerae bacterium RIFOXYB12_FULL_65_16]